MTKQLAHKVLEACATLSQFTETSGQINRPYLCASSRQVTGFLRDWADQLGLVTRIDAAGNIRSRRESSSANAPTFYIGSHLDTVPDAGAYDGILGVVMGYALAEALGQKKLPYTLEIIGFSEEEGVRYGASYLGSRALIGTLDALLDVTDAAGISIKEAITDFGLNTLELPNAMLNGKTLGYFEIHIEQGPVLEAAGQSLGIVSAIVGQSRKMLNFIGRASHAGTTPMYLRRDALAAAAHFIVAAEEIARKTDGLVATVGFMEVKPSAGNVVPAQAICSLDIRHAQDDVRMVALEQLLAKAEAFATERQVILEVRSLMAEDATPMSEGLKTLLHQAAELVGLPHSELVSGAGHDAQIMAGVVPTAMLFLRSPAGLSHHPDEAVIETDVEDALTVGLKFLQLLALKLS